MKFPVEIFLANTLLGSSKPLKSMNSASQEELDAHVQKWMLESAPRLRKFAELWGYDAKGTLHVLAKGEA